MWRDPVDINDVDSTYTLDCRISNGIQSVNDNKHVWLVKLQECCCSNRPWLNDHWAWMLKCRLQCCRTEWSKKGARQKAEDEEQMKWCDKRADVCCEKRKEDKIGWLGAKRWAVERIKRNQINMREKLSLKKISNKEGGDKWTRIRCADVNLIVLKIETKRHFLNNRMRTRKEEIELRQIECESDF